MDISNRFLTEDRDKVKFSNKSLKILQTYTNRKSEGKNLFDVSVYQTNYGRERKSRNSNTDIGKICL